MNNPVESASSRPPHLPDVAWRLGWEELRRGVHTSGALAFVDIAGFTPLTEAFASEGAAGTEALVRVINDVFSPTIGAVAESGGDVLWFAGDAIAVYFDEADTGASGENSVARAERGSRELLTRLDAMAPIETPRGPVKLGAKVGVASGELWVRSVGERFPRLLFSGSAIGAAVAAQDRTDPGMVTVDTAVALQTIPRLPHQPMSADAADAALHQSLAARLRSGRSRFIDEHRPAVPFFFELGDRPFDEVVEIFDAAGAIADDLGGHLLQVSTGDKGNVGFAAVGAPQAVPEAEERAVVILDRLRALDERGWLRGGVAAGLCFAGRQGSSGRWEYGVSGDTTNVAARLMSKAQPGETLVTPAVAAKLEQVRKLVAMPPVTLKGKSEPMVLSQVLDAPELVSRPAAGGAGVLVEPALRLPLVGRTAEFAALGTAAADVVNRHEVGVVTIAGAAGTGKTRLASEFARHLADQGWTVADGAFDLHGSQNAYAAWQQVFRALMHQRGLQPSPQLLVQLLPSRERELPVVSGLLGVEMAETDLSRELPLEQRRSLREKLATELVVALADTSPVAIVLEDLHSSDEASRSLFQALASGAGLGPVLLVAATRPTDWLAEVAGRSATVVELKALSGATARTLVRDYASLRLGDSVSPELVDRIAAAAPGNPLLLRLLIDQVVQDGEDALNNVAPDVATLLRRRLDELPDDERTVVSMASVLGREFELGALQGSFADAGLPDQLEAVVDALAERAVFTNAGSTRAGPTKAGLPNAGVGYVFTHNTTAEVAYDQLNRAVRSDLHLGAGRHLEATAVDPWPVAEDLARHFDETEAMEPRRRYLELAGDKSASLFSNDEAIRYFTRLEAIAEPEAWPAIAFKRAESARHSGAWELADSDYEHASSNLEGLPAAKAYNGWVRLLVDTESPEAALKVLNSVEHKFDRGEPSAMKLFAASQAWAHSYAGDASGSRVWAERHRQLASTLGDRLGEFEADWISGMASWVDGDAATAASAVEQVVNGFRQMAAVAEEAIAAMDLGSILMDLGRPADGLRHWDRSRDIAVSTGDYKSTMYLHANEANANRLFGNAAGTVHHLRTAMEMALQRNATSVTGYLLCVWGSLALDVGDDQLASEVLTRAAVLNSRYGDSQMYANALCEYAWASLRLGDRRAPAVNDHARVAALSSDEAEACRLRSAILGMESEEVGAALTEFVRTSESALIRCEAAWWSLRLSETPDSLSIQSFEALVENHWSLLPQISFGRRLGSLDRSAPAPLLAPEPIDEGTLRTLLSMDTLDAICGLQDCEGDLAALRSEQAVSETATRTSAEANEESGRSC